MKHFYKTLVLFFIFSSYAFSQDTTKTKLWKWSIGMRVNMVEQTQRYSNQTPNSWWQDDISLYNNGYHSRTKDNSFAVGIIGNYYLKDNSFLRCNIGINKINIEMDANYPDPSGNLALFNASKKQNDQNFAFGIGWKIEKKNIFFYTGLEAVVAFYGKAFVHSYTELQEPKGTFYSSGENTGIIENGYSAGIGNFGGFAFNIKRFSIGGEITYAFLYSKYGGKQTFDGVSVLVNPSGANTVTKNTASYDNSLTIFEMSKIKPSIYLTYKF